MIVVNATLEFTPEAVEALKDAILTFQAETRKEEGNEDFTFSVEVDNPGTLRLTERWASKEALTNHLTQPHAAAFQAAMADYPPKGADMNFYEATKFDFP